MAVHVGLIMNAHCNHFSWLTHSIWQCFTCIPCFYIIKHQLPKPWKPEKYIDTAYETHEDFFITSFQYYQLWIIKIYLHPTMFYYLIQSLLYLFGFSPNVCIMSELVMFFFFLLLLTTSHSFFVIMTHVGQQFIICSFVWAS